MKRVAILGAGAMGSAFCFPLADSGVEVSLVGTHLDEQWIDAIRNTRVHPKLGVKLPDAVAAYRLDQLGEALDPLPDLLVLGVSSPGVGWAVDTLAAGLPGSVPILMLTKGLATLGGSLRILPDIVAAGLADSGGSEPAVGGVGGPCIASELAVRRHSSVVIGSRSEALLELIETMLIAPYYHPRPTRDLSGLEAAAALKNFYALGVGAAARREPAHNPAAGLFTQALTEMRYLAQHMGGQPETVDGLAGVGDLYVTCQAGRNSRMGGLLGGGLRYREAKAIHMPDDTIEGADLALAVGPAMVGLIASGALDSARLPLARSIIRAICENEELTFDWESHSCS